MSFKAPRFQFRLSTLLILMLATAVIMWINFVPRSQCVLINYEELDNDSWKNMEEAFFTTQGWPFYVSYSTLDIRTTPSWNGSFKEKEDKTQNSIKYWETYFDISGPDAISKKALLANMGIYGASMLLLYWLLERKWKKPTSRASNAG